jgi:putative sugar O-methyltransferase
MYSDYSLFIKNINKTNIIDSNFKSHNNYTSILEHVSENLGQEYINYIKKNFQEISNNDIIKFINLNDLYGNPKKYDLKLDETTINCSPTSLRYIYHALLILQYYKDTECDSIVEVGCGYGGLFLALNFFSNILNIKIFKYYIIDLPESLSLIDNYIKLHNTNVTYSIHNSNNFGSDIINENLFFISNYCFTEIDLNFRNKYMTNVVSKTKNGFITWQTIFDKINIKDITFCKQIKNIIEETPQTATNEYKNYFVYY